jgi:hypothetical protein
MPSRYRSCSSRLIRGGLNAEQYLGFRNEEGIPLAPVVVRFKTRPADP